MEYLSNTVAFALGGKFTFADFVPTVGPNGGRNVIDQLIPVFDGTITAVGAVVQGEDVHRIFALLQVEQRDGRLRWNLSGAQSRIMAIAHNGMERWNENIDVVVAATPTVIRHPIPIAKHYTYDYHDYSLPAELLKKLFVQCGSLADFAIGGSTVSAITGNLYVIAVCHEEHDVVFHAEDEVSSTDFTSTAQCKLAASGRLADLVLWTAGASGGAALTNLTDVLVDGLVPTKLTRATDLEELYVQKRAQAKNLNSTVGVTVRSDPFLLGQAAAVILATQETSAIASPVMDTAIIRATNTVASLQALHRMVVPKSAANAAAVAAQYKVAPDSLEIKTRGHASKSRSEWKKEFRAYMPEKARVAKAA